MVKNADLMNVHQPRNFLKMVHAPNALYIKEHKEKKVKNVALIYVLLNRNYWKLERVKTAQSMKKLKMKEKNVVQILAQLLKF